MTELRQSEALAPEMRAKRPALHPFGSNHRRAARSLRSWPSTTSTSVNAASIRRIIAEGRQVLRQLRRDWCWLLVTGFLVYLGGFGPAPWYGRIIAPIVVLIVSSTVYFRWIAKLSRPQ
jgi:hypothetical protein